MKAFPVIYSRTKKQDYISGFLMRPKDMNYDKALAYVNMALNDVKYVDGLRHTIFGIGKYIVYGGVACVLKKMIERVGKQFNNSEALNDYLYDSSGREIAIFVGVAIERSDTNIIQGHVPNIDLEDLLNIYLGQINKYWNETYLETQYSEEMEIKSVPFVSSYRPECRKFRDFYVLDNYTEKNYKELLDYYFVQLSKDKQDYAVLSAATKEEIESNTIFKYIGLFHGSFEELNDMETFKTERNNISNNDGEIDKGGEKGKVGSDTRTSVKGVDDIQTENANPTQRKPTYNSDIKTTSDIYGKKKAMVCGMALVCLAILIGILIFLRR